MVIIIIIMISLITVPTGHSSTQSYPIVIVTVCHIHATQWIYSNYIIIMNNIMVIVSV